jgi:diguanylate cyclase (GGDEF)-like protein
MSGGETARQVKGTIAKTVLSYVRRVLGDEGVDRVFELAGMGLARQGLAAPASWTTTTDTIAIAEAAAVVCGDADIGRRGGEELIRMQRERGTIDFVRASGSVVAGLALTTNAGTKMSSGRRLELSESGANSAVITGTYAEAADIHPFFCAHTAGYFALVPEVFGYTSVIAETECMGRGDPRCVYRLTWSASEAEQAAVDVLAVEASRARMESFVARFEQLHTMATELVGAHDVDTLLARITQQAGVAVDAHRYLLAVDSGGDQPLRIHHSGFDDEESATRFATRLLANELEPTDRLLVAEVQSATRSYGRLAALYPRGSSATDMERRLLDAYARHAAAALEAVDALESARRDRDSAEALLGLAHALAEVGTKAEAAARVAAAVPTVTGCDRASVWLWDKEHQRLTLAGEHPDGRQRHGGAVLTTTDVPSLVDLARDPVPFLLRRADADRRVASMMAADGLEVYAVVPMRVRSEFVGVVAAGFADPHAEALGRHGELVDRLTGLADQAATAIDNATLLEAVQRQALHDGLTGLPNRRLTEDRAEQALREADRRGESVSLLFVDLDNFKSVNDNFGHEAGDQLLKHVTQRLAGCARAGDTVGRVGGDEFVAVLPRTDSAGARAAAARMVASLQRPFRLADREVTVRCSIGTASTPEDGGDYATLLKGADAAMYALKARPRTCAI